MKFIDEAEGLEEAIGQLKKADRLFIDTEFESNRKGTSLCLVQIADGSGAVYLIDAQALDINPLRKALGRKKVEWVMHAGKQDVDLLMEALGLRYRPRLFDTQVAWALLSPEHQVSLAYLEATLLGIVPEKGMQTDDWTRRPLSEAHLAYAAADVEHLPKLYDQLAERLNGHGRLELVFDVSREMLDPPTEPAPELSLGSFRNVWQLGGRQRAALEWMIGWYNGLEGEGRDAAPHRKVLFSVASRLPETKTALRGIKGVPRRFADKQGSDFVKAMHAAIAEVEDAQASSAPTPYATFDELYRDALFACAKADVCAAVEIAPEIAFPSWLSKALRQAVSHGDDWAQAANQFKGWRGLLAEPWRRFCASVGLGG